MSSRQHARLVGDEHVASLVPLDRLAPVLAAALDDERWLSSEAALMSGGKSNLTFEITSAAGAVVLRRPPSGPLLPRAHDMHREASVQRALSGSDVPVPAILFEDRDGDLIGAPFYVMQRVVGHVIRGSLPPRYAGTNVERAALTDALLDTLMALHAVDPVEVGLATFGRPEGFIQRQIRRWQEQSSRSPSQAVGELDALGLQLAGSAHTLRPGRTALIHGDYRLDNCVFDGSDCRRIAAVLDWELSTVGDPLADLGLLLFYWREPGEVPSALLPTVTTEPGFPNRAHLIRRYAAGTDIDLANLAFFEAFAHFKFAVIVQGIADRAAADAMAGQSFGDLAGEVTRWAAAGLERFESVS